MRAMPISLEAYLLTNLCMNIIVFSLVARSRGRIRWGGVFFAAAFGTLYAIAMQFEVFHQLRSVLARLLLAVALAAAAFPVDSLWELLGSTAALVGGTIFMGGVQHLIRQWTGSTAPAAFALGALLGGGALTAALNVRVRRMEKWEIGLELICGSNAVKLRALVDTGNRLHEPVSGLPVLIVGGDRLKSLLPAGLNPAEAA